MPDLRPKALRSALDRPWCVSTGFPGRGGAGSPPAASPDRIAAFAGSWIS